MEIALESERLIFREWCDEDVRAFHRICSDPHVMKYVGDGQPCPINLLSLIRYSDFLVGPH